MSTYHISPKGSMEQLSQLEVALLQKNNQGQLYQLYRNCSLAVLNSGAVTDDSRALFAQYPDFDIEILAQEKGIVLELRNPPESAFVDGIMITNIKYHLFSVLRDIVFVNVMEQRFNSCLPYEREDFSANLVFSILRNAKVFSVGYDPDLVVCWGGHSISQAEYQYCKKVGRELGLRELNIVTGCGAGVMEAPMRGAAIGHAHQRYKTSRFIGITEPSIIASEPPNPIVNSLVIMPDIEKRLEAFVRLGHSILVFPGGPGTLEELLYIIGIKLNPANKDLYLPVILTAPQESADYFYAIDRFIGETLGKETQAMYEIVIDDPVLVAQKMKRAMEQIKVNRSEMSEAFHYNWSVKISTEFTQPFIPTHESMRQLVLHSNLPKERLAANLRRAFSGIVAGNIKPKTQILIEQLGKFQLAGEAILMEKMDALLQTFIQQHRMKLPSDKPYEPCYELLKTEV